MLKLLSGNWLYFLVLALAIGLGGVSYLYKKEVKNSGYLSASIKELEGKLATSQADYKLLSSSCTIDDKSVTDNTNEQTTITTNTDQIDKALVNLKQKAIGTTTSGVSSKTNIIQGDNVNVKTPYVVPDDGLLSDDLYRLLLQSYCGTEPQDSVCQSTK